MTTRIENYKKVLLIRFILLLFIPLQVTGQIKTMDFDSLRQELNKETASNLDKAKTAGEIFRTLDGVYVDSALFFGRLSLKHALLAKDDEVIGNAAFKIASTFHKDDQLDSAKHYALSIVNDDRFSSLHKEKTLLYQILAGIKIRRSQIDSAEYFMLLARDAARLIKDPFNEIQVTHNLGIIEINKGKTIKAIEYFKEVMKLEAGRYPAQRINSLTALCGICLRSGLHDFGRPYCYEALSITKKADMNRSTAKIEDYLIQSFLEKNQLDSAIVHGQFMASRAVTEAQKLKSRLLLAKALVRNRETAKATEQIDLAVSTARPDILKRYSSILLQVNGIVQYESGNYEKSTKLLSDAEKENTRKNIFSAGRIETIEYLIQASLAGGIALPPSTVTTLRYVKDSLDRLYAQSASALSVQEYQNDKLTAEKLLLEEEAKTNELELQRRNLLLGLIGMLFVSSVLIAVLIRRESIRRKNLNLDLEAKNQEVSAAKIEVEQQNQRIQERNEKIQSLNADLNHRTSNYLDSIKILLERQRDSALAAGLDVSVVNSLERQVLAFTKVQSKLKETLDDVNLKEYLEDFCEAVRDALAAQGRPVQFDVKIADVDVKPAFAAPLALIINELATNSMKYARREDGLLRIALDAVEVNDGELRVFYRDGGEQDGEVDQRFFSSGQGVETILGFTDQLKGRVVRYGEESYDYEVVFGLEG